MEDVDQPEELQDEDGAHDEKEGGHAVTQHHGSSEEVQRAEVQKLSLLDDPVPEVVDLEDSGKVEDKGADHEDGKDSVVGEGGCGAVLHVRVEYLPHQEDQTHYIGSQNYKQ